MQLKKLLSVVMAVAVLTAIIPFGVFTASAETISGSCGDNVTWEYDTETATLTISGTGAMSDYGMYSINNGPYITAEPWAGYYKTIEKIVINTGVTSIAGAAFCSCTGLESIIIPNSVTSIGDYAFYGCTKLANVIIGNSVASIGELAFYGCTGLTSITIPDSVTSIGSGVFYGCSSLTEITLPFIGDKRHTSNDTYQYPFGYIFGADGGDGGTIQYYYGSSTSSKNRSTYYIPSTLKKVTITDCNYIQYGAFYNCTGLTSINIPNGVSSIGDSAFSGCTGLTSITIPDSVMSIGKGAFSGCAELTSVTIGNSVTSIGDYTFSGCKGLTSITVDSGNTVYYSSGNCIIETESKTIVAGCKNSIIPNDSSVTSIGEDAFYYCTGLTSITIPDSVTSIGNYAFCGCTELKSITIPDSVMSIGGAAFYGCTKLTSVTIGNSVTSIGTNAFSNCKGLMNITVDSGNTVYYSTGNCIIETKSKTLVAGCKSSTTPNDSSVTSIGDYAFYGCTGLTSITIPDSVTSIGNYAFYGCTGLKSITMLNSVTSIGGAAFRDCTGLTSVTIGNSVTSIGANAFYDCTGLKSIAIPNSVTSMGISAIPKSTSIICCKGSEAENYAELNGNTYVTIDDIGKCGEISEYYILGDKLYILGTGETDNWKTQGGVPWYDSAAQIKEVIIDEGVTKIGTYAFYCLDNLESVICKNEDLEFGRYALNTANENITVYAQNGALAEYCQNSDIKFTDVTPTPELVEFTANSITVKSVGGYEYSKDKEKWQTNGVFRSLSPVTEYNIYARLIKTKDEFPGRISEPMTVITDKLTVSAPQKPICIRNTDTEITLQANDLYEYSIDGENWQKSNVFSGLTHKNTYLLYQRIAETETEYASPASMPLTMQLVKKTVSAPTAPDYQSHTDNSIMLSPNNLYEYSLDGENWQKSSEFTGLSKNTIYRFYQRVAETETEYASGPSAALIIAIPDKPEILEAGYENILVKLIDGFQYCLDDFVWQDSNTFDKLIDNTEYYVYQRLKSVDGEKVYQITSEYTAVTTDNGIAHTHTFGEWSVKTEPTCTEKGTETGICTDCGETVTRDVNALGHDYKAVTTNPTCKDQGYTTYTCSRCGDSYVDDYTDALGHLHTEIRGAKEATCEEDGYTGDTYCTDCGAKIETGEVITALGHTESDWITDTEPSDQSAGERHKECTVCGKMLETEIIPKTSAPGDINGDGEVDNKDLTRLFQYLSNWDVEVSEAALDVNGDNSIDNKDLTRLFQYLSNWDVEIY